jgi:hypothetical protein
VISHRPTPTQLAFHNVDAILAALALPLFALAGWPLAGWFWAVALWALNRYLSAVIERRAAHAGALRGVGMMGASMLLRPWIGMLALFLITRHDRAEAVSSVVLLLVLLTADIATRIAVHRGAPDDVEGTAS